MEQIQIGNWNRQEETILRVGTTGIVKEDRVVHRNENIITKKKERKLTPQQKRLLQCKSDIIIHHEQLGGYIHMCYVKNELLFNNIDIDRANISRLIYLATYIDFNNRQENLLIKHGQCKVVEHMTKTDIKSVLDLSDTTFKSFINDMKNNNLLYEVDKKFYISNDYFNKGECSFEKKEYTRIYINTTRSLYRGCNSRQHKQLSYALQLIPFIHYKTNMLCTNPNEVDILKLDKLGLTRVCELLGISTDKKSMSRFENDLYKIQITSGKDKYYLFKRVIVKGGNGKFDYFVINPSIVWSGNDMDSMKDTLQVCFFK